MGVKSTTYLTRTEAEDKYVDLKMAIKRRKWQGQAVAAGEDADEFIERKFANKSRKWRGQAIALSDRDLGNVLDRLNDEHYRVNHDHDTSFENFLIGGE